jgi:hypothetical protein
MPRDGHAESGAEARMPLPGVYPRALTRTPSPPLGQASSACRNGRRDRDAPVSAAVWSVAALFLSVLSKYSSEITGSTKLALLGLIASVMLGVSCLAQVAIRRIATSAVGLGCCRSVWSASCSHHRSVTSACSSSAPWCPRDRARRRLYLRSARSQSTRGAGSARRGERRLLHMHLPGRVRVGHRGRDPGRRDLALHRGPRVSPR